MVPESIRLTLVVSPDILITDGVFGRDRTGSAPVEAERRSDDETAEEASHGSSAPSRSIWGRSFPRAAGFRLRAGKPCLGRRFGVGPGCSRGDNQFALDLP